MVFRLPTAKSVRAIRLPTDKDLRRLAEANYFELSDEELSVFMGLMPELFSSYELLEQMPLPYEPLKYRDRDSGYRPSREEDPFNAVVRRFSLRGAASGILAGKRVGLKNNVCMAGTPMTCGSLVLEGYIPESDATVVTRLLDAGAEIVANLNMENLALSGSGDTSAYGPVLNPRNPEYLVGGSSSGSAAALFYDFIDITIGGDQGGSIRIPASFCGVVGLKPTFGLVPYTGIFGVDHTVDHAGPMAQSVSDVALTLEAIAGKDPLDPRQGEVPVQSYTGSLDGDIKGLRIGVLAEGFGLAESEPDVDGAVRKAAEAFNGLGAQVREISIPIHREAAAVHFGIFAEGTAALLRSNGMGHHWEGLYNPGLAETFGKFRRAQANDFPPTAKLVLLIGTYMSEHYHGRMYAKAQNLRRLVRAGYDRALEQVDVLALPTTPMTAPKYEPDLDLMGLITHGWTSAVNTAPFDDSGHPAISIPCGKSKGLPVGMMLVTKRFDDATLLRAAHAFEQGVNWETL